MKRLLCSWIQFLSIRLGPPPGVAIRNLLGGASYTISLGCVLGFRTWGSGCLLMVSRTRICALASFRSRIQPLLAFLFSATWRRSIEEMLTKGIVPPLEKVGNSPSHFSTARS